MSNESAVAGKISEQKQELAKIIDELKSISSGVKTCATGIGVDKCSKSIDSVVIGLNKSLQNLELLIKAAGTSDS